MNKSLHVLMRFNRMNESLHVLMRFNTVTFSRRCGDGSDVSFRHAYGVVVCCEADFVLCVLFIGLNVSVFSR